jgi:Immunity protein Imm1
MRKLTYFDRFDQEGWPDPRELKPYFFAPPGQEWFNHYGNDTAGLTMEGLYGTENEDHIAERRVDLDFYIYGIPGLGVLLIYHKHGGGFSEAYTSKGDMRRLKEWVRNLHNDPLPVGLFIPFKSAWLAVKEFIETDGQLPKSIEWIANKELPVGTFPDPGSPHLVPD